MNSPLRPPSDDPLYALPDAMRPHYATGMLLDAADFADEQTYHRNRLARALAFASGAGARRLPPGVDPTTAGASGLFAGGTLAGLRVQQVPATAPAVEEIRIAPGLAVDRLGRLVEVPRAVCLRVDRWFAGELAARRSHPRRGIDRSCQAADPRQHHAAPCPRKGAAGG